MTDSESFFDTLRSQRESKNIEISEICEFTKINSQYIEAIESGDFNVLPNVYMRLFLRAYANFIGADSVKAMKDYELYTTGKVTKNEELNINDGGTISTPFSQTDSTLDTNLQISPQQIAMGTGVILIIFVLLWWAGRVTQEQIENIAPNKLKEEVAESILVPKEEMPKTESNLSESESQSNTHQALSSELEKQSGILTDKFPLNDNDFLSEKFDASNTITNFVLSPPYLISVHALEETKLHISEKQGDQTTELINKIVPIHWEQTFPFKSTIQFEFWSSSQISVNLNETSIDKYLNNGDMAIRGSYEVEKSQLYLSFYQR